MEDPRLSRMYARHFSQSLAKRRRRMSVWIDLRRGLLGRLGLLLLVAIFIAGYIAHMHGRFSRLKTELKARSETPVDTAPLPGGQEALVLQRSSMAGNAMPEFLSATLLPGRGMSVLQITASVPGRGEVPLFAAPSLEEATARMTGTGGDANGEENLRMGAPVELPWAGTIFSARPESGRQIGAIWRGRTLNLPGSGSDGARGGLVLKAGSDAVTHSVMPDGGSAEATFNGSNFGEHWPSSLSVMTSALLSSRAFELKVVVRNVGHEPTPFGIGWLPRFAFPAQRGRGILLHLPAEQREEMRGNRATGKLLPISGTALDFTPRAGKPVSDADLNETLTSLRTSFLDNGPVVELRDVESGYGIRMTALSNQTRAIHLEHHAGQSELTVGFQTNYNDPLSHVWPQADDGGLQILQPGQSLQWKVRLELFALNDSSATPF